MKTTIVYGIPNCNSVKKAMDWLKKNKINFDFHDFKKEGITKQKLKVWCTQLGWEAVLNKKGTTWRSLSEAEKGHIKNQTTAIDLMIQKTSLIKRPVIEFNSKWMIGFEEEKYQSFFK